MPTAVQVAAVSTIISKLPFFSLLGRKASRTQLFSLTSSSMTDTGIFLWNKKAESIRISTFAFLLNLWQALLYQFINFCQSVSMLRRTRSGTHVVENGREVRSRRTTRRDTINGMPFRDSLIGHPVIPQVVNIIERTERRCNTTDHDVNDPLPVKVVIIDSKLSLQPEAAEIVIIISAAPPSQEHIIRRITLHAARTATCWFVRLNIPVAHDSRRVNPSCNDSRYIRCNRHQDNAGSTGDTVKSRIGTDNSFRDGFL